MGSYWKVKFWICYYLAKNFTCLDFDMLAFAFRYVATAVTSVHEMENGFNIWSFNGKLLYRILKDHFFQVMPFESMH